jgi:hypothetical protein
MPSPEGEHQRHSDDERRQEEEPLAYYRAARFVEERLAARVYGEVQSAIQGTPCDLSAYRLLIDRVSHVTVIGDEPPTELDEALANVLSLGDATELPTTVVQALLERRRNASRLGPWVERHHRPGQPP